MRRWLNSLLAAGFLMSVLGVAFAPGAAAAGLAQPRIRAVACSGSVATFTHNANPGYTETDNDGCQAGAKGVGGTANCSSAPAKVNMDLWQTRNWPGGTRYKETGRTGDVTFPNDCVEYKELSDNVNPALSPDPSWACTWEEIQDYAPWSYDYQCNVFPKNYND